ncbi:MAG: Mur ligase family protein [Bacillus subtilis]|nr:Mur ligase family protein [Bacillus subtilis]
MTGIISLCRLKKKEQSAIISQKEMPDISIPNIVTLNTQLALAQLANVFYDFPSKKLKVIGVTGTNGKTSSTHLIENIFEEAGLKCGLIGTLGQRFSSVDDYISTNHTTPQAPDLFKALHDMLNNDIRHVVMEVSSHALEQYRVEGCEFNGAALTNLTQDHLDYHITMDNYFFAKSKLFTLLKSNSNKYAVINNDDSYAERFKGVVPQGVKTLTYGIEKESDIMAKNLEFSVYGSKFECSTPFGNKSINLQMAGLFSVYNALCSFSGWNWRRNRHRYLRKSS